MPRVACPHCKHIQSATEEQRGTILVCDECGRRIRVPPGKTAAPAPVRQELEDKTPPPPAKAQAKLRPAKPSSMRPEPAGNDRAGEPDQPAPPRKRVKKKRAKTSQITAIFGGVGSLLGLAVLWLMLSGRWKTLIWEPLQEFLEQQGIPPLAAVIVVGLVLIIPLSLWQGLSMKAAALNNIAVELDFLPTKPEHFPELDAKALKGLTEAFLALGFTHLMDYRLETELENQGKGFARLFAHPEEYCFAEINQAFASGGTASTMGCNLTSYLEEGWSFSTGNRRPTSTLYVLRRPKGLWLSQPNEPPEKLLQVHLKRRNKIARDLGLDLLTDTEAEAHFDHERQAARDRKKAVQGRSFVRVAFDMWFFERNPRYEWMGDLAHAAVGKT